MRPQLMRPAFYTTVCAYVKFGRPKGVTLQEEPLSYCLPLCSVAAQFTVEISLHEYGRTHTKVSGRA